MKILIIIDNLFLYKRVKNIIEIKNLNGIGIDYRHSAGESEISNYEDFMNQKHSIIDVKNNVEFILQNYSLVISIHCKQLFPKELVDHIRCINIHPGFIPINRGWYPQVFSIINNTIIGATIHEIDNNLDNGPIIARDTVESYSWDTSESLYIRILYKELELFDLYFESIVYNTYKSFLPESHGNIYYKKDFNSLREIKLDEMVTFKEALDRFRALTHGGHLNAYFIDPDTQKKVFIQISLINQ